jgi:hypothetical protein
LEQERESWRESQLRQYRLANCRKQRRRGGELWSSRAGLNKSRLCINEIKSISVLPGTTLIPKFLAKLSESVDKMGLGVLEDHHLQHVPGTALLADIVEASQHQHRGRDTSALKHGTGRNADIVLVPQPSESPRDPLNWPQWKKELLLLIISIDTAVVGAWGPMISPGFAQMAMQFNMSYNSRE